MPSFLPLFIKRCLAFKNSSKIYYPLLKKIKWFRIKGSVLQKHTMLHCLGGSGLRWACGADSAAASQQQGFSAQRLELTRKYHPQTLHLQSPDPGHSLGLSSPSSTWSPSVQSLLKNYSLHTSAGLALGL